MKFDDKYPSAKVGDEPQLCLIKRDGLMPCEICHELTCWAEINWYGPFCSEECLNVLEEEYANYVQQRSPDESDPNSLV